MSLRLYAHPFSSYCQKVLIALYENGTPFEFRMLAVGDEQAAAEHAALWPLKRMTRALNPAKSVAKSEAPLRDPSWRMRSRFSFATRWRCVAPL